MFLHKIESDDRVAVHVVARSADEAADIFVTWRAARGSAPRRFTVECIPSENLEGIQQEQVRNALAAGLVGVAHLDPEIGWTFSAPMWVPLAPDELRACEGASA
jgi:hypothetical protein